MRHGDKRQHGEYRAGLKVKTSSLRHIDVKPRVEQPGNIAEGEVARGQGKHRFAAEDLCPGNRGLAALQIAA